MTRTSRIYDDELRSRGRSYEVEATNSPHRFPVGGGWYFVLIAEVIVILGSTYIGGRVFESFC